MPSSQSYTATQTTFALSILSNFSWREFATAKAMEEELANFITHLFAQSTFSNLVGDWELAWGPAIYQAELSVVADNTVYVARKISSPNELMVSVAGTNPYSIYGLLVEDLEVNHTVPWPKAPGCVIAKGSADGLAAVTDTAPTGGRGHQNLVDFLVASSPSKVTVTGHSLGGTLSPVLAVYLREHLANTVEVCAMPFAGATAGNAAFAEYGDGLLGKGLVRIWNKLDVVPHAWNVSDLADVPTLYQPNLKGSLVVDALVAAALTLSTSTSYTHMGANAEPLLGSYLPTAPTDDSTKAFLEQMALQHVEAYFNLLDVPALLPLLKTRLDHLLAGVSLQDQYLKFKQLD